MKLRKSLLAAACAGIAVLGFIPLIHADESE